MQINQKTYLATRITEQNEISDICKSLCIDFAEVKALNHANNFNVGDVVLLSKRYTKSYVVKPLDTKQTIAKSLNITERELDEILDGEKLFLGKRILIK